MGAQTNRSRRCWGVNTFRKLARRRRKKRGGNKSGRRKEARRPESKTKTVVTVARVAPGAVPRRFVVAVVPGLLLPASGLKTVLVPHGLEEKAATRGCVRKKARPYV